MGVAANDRLPSEEVLAVARRVWKYDTYSVKEVVTHTPRSSNALDRMLVYPKNRYDQSMVKLFMGRNRLAKGAEENSLKMEHGQYHLGSYGRGVLPRLEKTCLEDKLVRRWHQFER